MLKLLLYRHAKSDWTGGVSDKQRVLNPRGRKAAPKMAAHLLKSGDVPAKILCSTAARTRETLELTVDEFRQETGNAPEIVMLDDLYHAGHWTIRELIQEHGGTASPLMIIAHNPGLQDAGLELTGSAVDPSHLIRLENKLPTAAVLTIQFDAENWADIKEGTGTLTGFVRPKQLGK